MKYSTGLLAATLTSAIVALGLFGTVNAQSKPKYTIKQIMKDGLKGGLAKKVVGGKATDKEKIQLTRKHSVSVPILLQYIRFDRVRGNIPLVHGFPQVHVPCHGLSFAQFG